MAKVKNEGNDIFLTSGKWFKNGVLLDITNSEVELLKMINHKISIIEDKKKKK